RFVIAQLKVKRGYEPIARVERLAGGLSIMAFVDVPQARRAQIRQSQGRSRSQQQEIMSSPMIQPMEHSLFLLKCLAGFRFPNRNANYREKAFFCRCTKGLGQVPDKTKRRQTSIMLTRVFTSVVDGFLEE